MQRTLIISNTTDMLRILPTDIMCIKAEGNYSTLTTTEGDDSLISFQLGQIEQMIGEQLEEEDANMFIRIGRGAIINRKYIFTINIPHQQLCLRSDRGKRARIEASRESLKQLKLYIEKVK